ncbi:TonB-dependent receptor [Caulobacter segnis]|uniref:TonB-dependent receptor n=1 Tax=Caulobacter segnis TaxID=88688 RepID=UPI002410888D|nr:TonB-dependent receptor [Caulobacter segnis]MDG2521190.1 TonB-dependent receptor [Caulobacter segnis]
MTIQSSARRARLRRVGGLLMAGASLAALAVAFAGPVRAQTASDETAAAALDEIVVTARRRDERLQDVPAAVTAFSSTALRNMQATNVGDLQGSAPNLTIHEGDASNAVVYVRGVGQIDSLAFADPGVGVYVDDVYLGRAQGAFLDVYDVDRIEMLRGPQGTLYGRNTIGGAVKFVSKPLTNDFAGALEATVGDYERVELKGSVGGALVQDKLLAKAAFVYSARDGYSLNALDGRTDGDKNLLAGRLAFEYRASEDFSLRLNIDGSRDRPDRSRTPARATAVFGAPPTLNNPFDVNASFNTLADLSTAGVSLVADWKLSDAVGLKSITAYRKMSYDSNLDLDATTQAIFGVYVREDQDQISQELQLNYTGDRFTAVGGLFWFKEHDDTFSGLLGPAISLVTGSQNDQHNESWAAYGQGTYSLTDHLSVTAGLRYTHEKKDFFRTQKFFAPTVTTLPVPYDQGPFATFIDTSDEWSSFTPRFGLDYKISDDVLAYASVSRGFKSGGFDGRANDAAGARPYDPETLWAYEAGLKSTLLDRRLTANFAVFWNDYKDLQLSSFTADSSGAFTALFTNAGAATIRGAELELVARPIRPLTLNFVLGYLDGRYDEYIGPGGRDISDQRELVNAPKWDGKIGANYRFDLADGGSLTVGADAAFRSKTYRTVSSSEILAQKGYVLVDAFARWQDARDKWFVQAGVKNLTDKRYIEQGFDLSDSLGYQLAYFGAPRTVSATIGVAF